MKRKRLLVLASTYPRWLGDYEPGFVHELSKRLVSSYDVMVLCPHSTGALRYEVLEGVRVVRYRYAPERLEKLVNDGGILANVRANPLLFLLVPLFIVCQFFCLLIAYYKFRPHVVHAHWVIPQGFVFSIFAFLFRVNVPLLVTSHGSDLFSFKGSVFKSIKRFVFKRSKKISVVSRSMQRELLHLGFDSSDVVVSPMGVDLENRFTPGRSDLERSDLLFVGRFVEKKGVPTLLNAMPIILKKFPDLKLRLVGFGPEYSKLKQLAADLSIEDKVSFEGAKSHEELVPIYQSSKLFVAPFEEAPSGDQEGLGLVLVEALGCGCPAVVSDVEAVSDVIYGLKGVVQVHQKNSALLAEAVCEVLVNHQSITSEVLMTIPDLKSKFDWGAVAKKYDGLIEEIAVDSSRN